MFRTCGAGPYLLEQLLHSCKMCDPVERRASILVVMEKRTKDKPWKLKTPPGTSEYTMHVEEKDGKVIRQERRYGRYLRSFDLGPDAREGDIEATFADGILTVKAPKTTPKAPEAKRIKVS